MITKTKQVWEVGEVVKVGFLKLRITAKVPTPGDYMPDEYHLCGLGEHSNRKYTFVPHYGLTRL